MADGMDRISMGAEIVRKALGDTKRPLFRPVAPAPDFPTGALGPLQDAVQAVQHRTQAPLAICAQSMLAAATLAIQAHRNVELRRRGKAADRLVCLGRRQRGT